MTFLVTIHALTKDNLSVTTERLSIPTITGRIEILPKHLPLATILEIGVLEWGKAGISCNRIITYAGIAVVLKDARVNVFVKGWQKNESRDELASQIMSIKENVARIKEEILILKDQNAELGELTKKETILGIEKARIDMARRSGLSI
jgi:F0F1-type ATP synthase epsilon subunit